MKQYLGIDMGASSFKYGIGNSRDGLLHFGTVRIHEKSLEAVRQNILALLEDVKDFHFEGVGLGTPGTIDRKTGKIFGVNPNLKFFTDMSPAELFPKDFPLPVLYDNDANLMALAESSYEPCRLCFGVTVGSGIGGGIIVDGKIFHGAGGFAAEIGHTIAVLDGIACNCGMQGCLETYASVDGIRRRLQKAQSPFADMDLPTIIAQSKSDAFVKKTVAEGETHLIQALANICNILNPDLIVLGGGAMDLGLYDIDKIREEVFLRISLAHRKELKIELARFGNRAGVMGGIILCERS
ncbi:MAG: ROK family protein [Candidatus Cloacimonetes bacterium]|jgi:glucokinase|nr:ROK family protein [Candidatus Cloacimonadota bacterium]